MKKDFSNAIEKTTTTPVLKTDGMVTNSRPDGHAKFCKRCFKQNGKCLNNGTKRVDPDCHV